MKLPEKQPTKRNSGQAAVLSTVGRIKEDEYVSPSVCDSGTGKQSECTEADEAIRAPC